MKNVNQCFPKSKVMSSNVLFYSQPKDIQFTVREEERNQKLIISLPRFIVAALVKYTTFYGTLRWSLSCWSLIRALQVLQTEGDYACDIFLSKEEFVKALLHSPNVYNQRTTGESTWPPERSQMSHWMGRHFKANTQRRTLPAQEASSTTQPKQLFCPTACNFPLASIPAPSIRLLPGSSHTTRESIIIPLLPSPLFRSQPLIWQNSLVHFPHSARPLTFSLYRPPHLHDPVPPARWQVVGSETTAAAFRAFIL